jgi:hypothetical protein
MTFSSMQRRWLPPAPDLPPYLPRHGATAHAERIERSARQWGQTARGLRDEIAATEEALVAALDAQDRRDANRARLRAAANVNTDRGLR